MDEETEQRLSRRMGEILDLAYQLGSITAADLERLLKPPPANSTVRTQLRTLEERGHLRHFEENGRFVYVPAKARPSAAVAAMRRFLTTFVGGSASEALTTLLSAKETDLSDAEWDRLEELIRKAREGKSQ
jgi:predicted transcriptional regulator